MILGKQVSAYSHSLGGYQDADDPNHHQEQLQAHQVRYTLDSTPSVCSCLVADL